MYNKRTFKRYITFKGILSENNSASGYQKGVWIAPGCIILQGVSIGECAVIGTGAVVTKDVPSWSVAVGMPAKVIKKLKNDQNEFA